MDTPTNSSKIYLLLVSILGWFALIAQFYINVNSKAALLQELIVRYFSYFTILTNLLVAVCCTTLWALPRSRWGMFFSKPKTLTAITVYITVVGLIYNVILRFLWQPQGLQRLVDELLHSVIPVLFIIYWLVFVTKSPLQWKSAIPWLLYPIAYTVFIFIRGAASGFYPYPFIDAAKLGATQTAINATGIAGIFLGFSLLFIGIAKAITKQTNHQ